MSESKAATEMARRLWDRGVGDMSSPEELATATDRICAELRVRLGRWVGVQGYQVLVARALRVAETEHQALRGMACNGDDGPVIAAAVRAYGPAGVSAGVVALLAALIELLGHILGEEIAVRLVGETGRSSDG